MAMHDEDDGLCVLCYAQPRVLRYRPCGHCVACERCAIRHVLAQLQAGELRPRCSHGCGAEIVDVLRVERADPPIFERDEGNASCQPGAHSLEAFLERAAQKVLRCSVAQDASQAWLRLREAAGARRQLAFFEAVEAGDLDGCVALRRAGASVAQLLRERGADLAAADLDGRTALHFASVNGHLEAGCLARNASDSPESACLARAVRRLLRALDYACFSGHTAVARYLCGLASGACRTETELRLVLRHPRLKLEQLVEGGYCISALQRLAATELRAVGIEGGAMKQGHAARLAKHFHEAVEEVAGSAVASLGEGIFTGFSLDRTEGG
ncbi:hypothetical protein EMIHUDRAFT_216614 [Emiliania huxleyi CCMP1516]|uniref:RING-type domain-containing protein n=2 Tax=Emiliania huxleyi TaxID=2903 RepID=A0A0D3IDB0_EMIH1|nr:hypothetical protein EMIHUDRAFT_216614 [Emiliania huxleyi CCMP1516]EOD09245.1 hypothetical protein EMIHUDRAFT_216614 [Emiliania huxleyi CCMP1516]|eukprot:XP_005761674.1 hypothetical protein EMIHUDRAFT_216614 [Emiliania huxleyi CCMP1516]